MMLDLLILNGPLRAGKTTTAILLKKKLGDNVVHMKMSDPIKEGTHRLYGLEVAIDHYESTKDLPNSSFRGATPREAYISYSQSLTNRYGFRAITNLFLDRLNKVNAVEGTVILDAGVQMEVDPLFFAPQFSSTTVLRLPRFRHTTINDIRGRIEHPHGHHIDMISDGTIEGLKKSLQTLLDSHPRISALNAVRLSGPQTAHSLSCDH